jgi:hypothetical protein
MVPDDVWSLGAQHGADLESFRLPVLYWQLDQTSFVEPYYGQEWFSFASALASLCCVLLYFDSR